MEVLKLSYQAYKQYKALVNGNEDIRIHDAEKKLTRCMHLAIPLSKTLDGEGIIYSYGSMRFLVKHGEVKWVGNRFFVPPMWYKDEGKYFELTVKLGIA
ncbi:hypothetical protein ABE073_04540 [Lederbergia citrisecunda]|uniref:hypothetical protein n=1 Tax=Lederbergia citrisecunda TaxID=2833583 RepID=UPI003D2A7031